MLSRQLCLKPPRVQGPVAQGPDLLPQIESILVDSLRTEGAERNCGGSTLGCGEHSFVSSHLLHL